MLKLGRHAREQLVQPTATRLTVHTDVADNGHVGFVEEGEELSRTDTQVRAVPCLPARRRLGARCLDLAEAG
jgi:hypothetical protein